MSSEWLVIRGSGIAAFALLSAATLWGLLVSTKLVSKFVRAKPLTWFHESLGIGALLATVVHIGVLSVHEYLPFSWREILVPGTSTWRPIAVALGTVGFYGLVVVTSSFYLRRWIGQKAWRYIHFGSFGVFVASLLHGIKAGTDSSSPLLLGLYAGAAIAVFTLAAQRMVARTSSAEPSSPPLAAEMRSGA
jgi:predicted ferric reductase